MKHVFVFALCLLFVACSRPEPTSTPLIPTATVASTIKIPETAFPTVNPTPTTAPYATRAPFPVDFYFNNPRFVTESDLAIAFSLNFLKLRDYFMGYYENALFSPIEFPDGSKGAFVAMGFDPPRRGYKFVYRIERESFQVVQIWQDDYSWGTTWGNASHIAKGKVPLEFPELIYDIEGKPIPLIEVSGVHYPGVGLIDDGHFQILQVIDDGVKVIFSGSKLIRMGDEKEYHYQYTDLDADGNKEIIKDGEECNVVQNDDGTWKRINCKPIHEIYKYNGVEYVKQP